MSDNNQGRVVEEGITYQIVVADTFCKRAIHCKACEKTSYNCKDVEFRYCGKCETFHVPGKRV